MLMRTAPGKTSTHSLLAILSPAVALHITCSSLGRDSVMGNERCPKPILTHRLRVRMLTICAMHGLEGVNQQWKSTHMEKRINIKRINKLKI